MPGETRYIREPPAVHPAVAGAVMRGAAVTDAEVIATLLYLSQTGVLTMRTSTRHVTGIFGAVERDTHEFVVNAARWAGATRADQELVHLLFTRMMHSGALSLEDLKVLIRSKESTYRQGLAEWQRWVVGQAIHEGYLKPPNGAKRTEAGDALVAQCEAFRAYIHDFGRLEDDTLMQIELWGPYLVWASLFGLATRVTRTMRLKGAGYADDLLLAAEGLGD